MRTVLLASILLAALGATAIAEPESGPGWVVELGSTERWPTSPSAVTLTESNLSGGSLAVDRRLTTIGLPGPFATLDLAAGLEFERATADGTTFDQLDNHISTWRLAAAGHARLPLRWGFLAQVRGSIGGGKTNVRIADARMPTIAIADDGASMIVDGGIGLAFLPRMTRRDRGRFHMGVEVELGYVLTSARSIRALPEDRPPPELTIPASYASLGDLDLDGWVLRAGVAFGF